MLVFSSFLSTESKKTKKDLLTERVRLETQRDYLARKIKYLSSKQLDKKLLVLTCHDSPIARKNLTSLGAMRSFAKKSASYYKKNLLMIEKELKKINKVLLKN